MKTFPQVAAFKGNDSTIRIIGHRGARGIMPENSMIGFEFNTVKWCQPIRV
jgi:glycerophosphoryl diester phosphodiesterase